MSHQFTEHVTVKQNESRKVWRPRGLSVAREFTEKYLALFQTLSLASIFEGYGTFSISSLQITVLIIKKELHHFFFNFQIFYYYALVLNLTPVRQPALYRIIRPLDFVFGYTSKFGSIDDFAYRGTPSDLRDLVFLVL